MLYYVMAGSVDSGLVRRVSGDSVFAFPVASGGYSLYADSRHGREGIWLGPAPGGGDSSAAPRRILIASAFGLPASDGSWLMCTRSAGKAYRIMLPEGTLVPIPGTFSGFSPASGAGLSFDNREMVYTENTLASKLVMIEKLR